MSESSTITVYERWYRDDKGDVYRELYTLVNVEKRWIENRKTPYTNPPVIMIDCHMIHDE